MAACGIKSALILYYQVITYYTVVQLVVAAEPVPPADLEPHPLAQADPAETLQ